MIVRILAFFGTFAFVCVQTFQFFVHAHILLARYPPVCDVFPLDIK